MVEIVSIDHLHRGDIIMLENGDDICLVTVGKTGDCLITPEEFNGLHYVPEDPDKIIRIGTKEEEPVLTLMAKKMHLKLSKDWQKVVYKE